VLGSHIVAYLDFGGSRAETSARPPAALLPCRPATADRRGRGAGGHL